MREMGVRNLIAFCSDYKRQAEGGDESINDRMICGCPTLNARSRSRHRKNCSSRREPARRAFVDAARKTTNTLTTLDQPHHGRWSRLTVKITASITYDMAAALMILEVRTPFSKTAGGSFRGGTSK
jgi:hypothetical protein